MSWRGVYQRRLLQKHLLRSFRSCFFLPFLNYSDVAFFKLDSSCTFLDLQTRGDAWQTALASWGEEPPATRMGRHKHFRPSDCLIRFDFLALD